MVLCSSLRRARECRRRATAKNRSCAHCVIPLVESYRGALNARRSGRCAGPVPQVSWWAGAPLASLGYYLVADHLEYRRAEIAQVERVTYNPRLSLALFHFSENAREVIRFDLVQR